MIFRTNRNTLAKFHNLAAPQVFQVLIRQIWAAALALPQQTYWSSTSAFSQAMLSISHRALPDGLEAGQGASEESPSSLSSSWLPVQPMLEHSLTSILDQYWKCSQNLSWHPRTGGIPGSVSLEDTPGWKLDFSRDKQDSFLLSFLSIW